MTFADIMRQCFEGQMLEAGIPPEEAKRRANKAVEKIVKRTGLRAERKLVRLAVYEARCQGASVIELEIQFNLARRTVFKYIREEMEARRAS